MSGGRTIFVRKLIAGALGLKFGLRPPQGFGGCRCRNLSLHKTLRSQRAHAMSDRFAERSQNAMSDAVELAFYSILFLLIVLLWVYVPA